MRRLSETVSNKDLKALVLARAGGRPFYVTCADNIPAILAEGAIIPRHSGVPASPFGSYPNAYFPLRGCVSVFDFRHASKRELDVGWEACNPSGALHRCGDRIALFFLTASAAARLEPWPDWKVHPEGQMVAPYVEAGHFGPLELESIEELLTIEVTRECCAHIDALRVVTERERE